MLDRSENSGVWPRAAEVDALLAELEALPFDTLLNRAYRLARTGHGDRISFSPKVFIPLTRLCRDVCAYCTFAKPPRRGTRVYMSPDEVLEVARGGARLACSEALFTLGDHPEHRYRAARRELDAMGYGSTADYVGAMADLVLRETGLIPHINAGVMDRADLARMRAVSGSQGIMLESTSAALLTRGGAHYGCASKQPQARIDTIAEAGDLAIPFTTGILAGIGESRRDRIESLMVIAALQRTHGHIQEVIVQNFQPKADTRMAETPALPLAEFLWTIAAARLVLGPAMNIQAPPNLSFGDFPQLLRAGLNDWGGVSPLTPDHVNPEAAWPTLAKLRTATEAAGLSLVPRLPLYPAYMRDRDRWCAPQVGTALLRASDAEGWARHDAWSPGRADIAPSLPRATPRPAGARLERILARAGRGDRLAPEEICMLFETRGADLDAVRDAADDLRRRTCGETVRYVVNRNVNYTNICGHRCQFCAFSKGKLAENLRGRPYDLELEEISRRAAEAWERGATEICMQGGIHPHYTGQTYLDLLAAAKRGAPRLHVHAFSPLEISHGAATLDISPRRFLHRLREAGLGSLPGTAAEVLDDTARAILCTDKLSTEEWIGIIGTAHEIGLPTTSTIMFGHVDRPEQWARHLLALRDLQERTGGITEFVPLPFVHMEAPLYHKGRARRGPTFRETVLMHAVARLVLHPLIENIQTSWVKLGPEGTAAALAAGANDLGGTLMNESISRAAGTQHGQELGPERMDALIRAAGRWPAQRTTLYGTPPQEQTARAYGAAELQPLVNGRVRRPGRRKAPAGRTEHVKKEDAL